MPHTRKQAGCSLRPRQARLAPIQTTTVYESAAILAEVSFLHAAMPGLAALDRLVIDDLHDSPTIPEALTALTYLVARWGVKVTD